MKLPGWLGRLLVKKPSLSEDEQAHSGRKHDRAPRIQLLPLHHVRFWLESPPVAGGAPGAEAIGLVNLSVTGAAFPKAAQGLLPGPGQDFSGQLELTGEKLPIQLRVVHSSGSSVGCVFLQIPANVQEAVLRYFELELSALSMQKARTESLKQDPDGSPHWFFGKNNCELYFVTQGVQIVRFHFNFFANYVEGAPGKRARFGRIQEDRSSDKPKYESSSLIRWSARPSFEMNQVALKFLRNIENLEPQFLDQIAQALSYEDGGTPIP